MRLLVIATIAGSLLCGCAARKPSEGRDGIVEGIEQLAAFARTAASYRDGTGRWPSAAIELANAPGAPASEWLEQLDKLVWLRPGSRDLLVIDRRSGDSIFRIATDGRVTMVAANGGG